MQECACRGMQAGSERLLRNKQPHRSSSHSRCSLLGSVCLTGQGSALPVAQ